MYFSEFSGAFISIICCNTVAEGSVNGTLGPIHIERKQRGKRKRSQTIDFFLINVLPNLLNSVTKIFVITVKGFERATQSPLVWGTSTCKTHVRNSIFKLTSIHASVIYQIPWIHWIPFLLMKTLISTENIKQNFHFRSLPLSVGVNRP